MGADKQECHVLQYVRNVWEMVTAIKHRLRTIVSLVKMNCNEQCNVQLITDGHYFNIYIVNI